MRPGDGLGRLPGRGLPRARRRGWSQAWARWPETRPKIPADEDEELHARRLVAQRCLYGVDKNPLRGRSRQAVAVARDLARDHEFTFLDHALKCGDSLVGLTTRADRGGALGHRKPGLPLFRNLIRERFEAALTGRAEIRDAPDDVERAIQEARYQRIERRLSDARLIGDAVIAAFFSADKPRAREAKRQEIESWLNEPAEAVWARLRELVVSFSEHEGPISPFHWEIEYPEIFARSTPGFDAIVGNPPFLGGKRISSELGDSYRDWLGLLHAGVNRNMDLIGHFFRRVFQLLAPRGVFGLIATNTIAQGDTRDGGLAAILRQGGYIINATRRLAWPGEAAVIVSVIHVSKQVARFGVLDGSQVPRISAYLLRGDFNERPARLRANSNKAFIGSVVLGVGFTFDDVGATRGVATSIGQMQELIREEPKNSTCIFPYIGGEEINNSPTLSAHRYIINFRDYSEVFCKTHWPALLSIIEEKVRPERLKVKDNTDGLKYKKFWWQYARKGEQLYDTIVSLPRVLVIPLISPHLCVAMLKTGFVYSHKLGVFAFAEPSAFACLQTRVHETWVRTFTSTLKDDLNYSPSDCFETFPLPDPVASDPALEEIGRAYHDHRAQIMVARNEGMTKYSTIDFIV